MNKTDTQKILLNEKEIPIIGRYDVVVAGGGTSGAVAAISAAMEGLNVLVLEQSGSLGGTSTIGLVSPIMGAWIKGYSVGKLNRPTKLRGTIAKMLAESGEYDDRFDGVFFNPIRQAVVLEEVFENHGGEVLFHTVLIDVKRVGNKVTHAIVYNKGGISAVEAKVFIDCTGDADLCVMAGVPTFSGNRDGVNQNVSLRFEMAQVDIPKYEAFMKRISESEGGRAAFMRQKYEEGYIREQDIYHFQTFRVPGKPNCLAFNCPELGRTAGVIDPRYMSRQQIEGKRAVMKLAKFCRECVEGFENAFVTQISPILGIRDSRRIQAEYMLSSEDIHAFRKFPDGISVSNYPLDAHGEAEYGKGMWQYDPNTPEGERYYEIPFRSLIPIGVDNLLCAGRCVGTDFFAQSTTRIQHSCHYMGEAVGIAARLAIESGEPVRMLDGARVRAVMVERGDILLAKDYN